MPASVTLSSSESAPRKTRFDDFETVEAMSRAASSLRSWMKPGLSLIASPMSCAAFASPSALMIADFLSCFALSATTRALGVLRRLLRLDRRRVLLAEGEVGDRHVVEDDVEVGGAAHEHLPDVAAHRLALRDQLRRVVLRDDRLDVSFTIDGSTLVVVGASSR